VLGRFVLPTTWLRAGCFLMGRRSMTVGFADWSCHANAKLQNYRWPGNIRELRNVIERALIIARDGALDFDLPVAESAMVPPRPAAHAKSDAEPEFLTEAEIHRRERNNLLTILERTRWKIKGAKGAAELLGVKATTLKARMKKMGLKRPD